LQDVTEALHLVDARAQIVQSAILISVDQHHESVAFTRRILLLLQEVSDEFRGIRDQHIVRPVMGGNPITAFLSIPQYTAFSVVLSGHLAILLNASESEGWDDDDGKFYMRR